MPAKQLYNIVLFLKTFLILVFAYLFLLPAECFATQLHASSEGIITHQAGHLFFLFSMVALILTISGKNLGSQKGWRLIQYSAFFFVLWNLDAFTAHFLDNQVHAVKIENISLWTLDIVAYNDSQLLGFVYYILKLDHLLCVPAMLLLYKGISSLVNDHKKQISVNIK
ncbi:MAG: hypothetical protein ABFR31_00520 [Thermodesulfobacteriota bacterium]